MKTNRPLGISPTEEFTAMQMEKFRKIEAARFDFVEIKLLEGGRLSKGEVPLALKEFKRFCALVALEVKPLAMIGPKVDEVWHQFILFTSQYREFCETAIGRFVNHQPNTSVTPVPAVAWKNFVENYQRYFGEIPNIWFSGLDNAAVEYFYGKAATAPLRWSGWTGD
jgi:hypothetical protein